MEVFVEVLGPEFNPSIHVKVEGKNGPTTLSPYLHKHPLRHTHAHHNHTHANKVKFLKVVGEGVADLRQPCASGASSPCPAVHPQICSLKFLELQATLLNLRVRVQQPEEELKALPCVRAAGKQTEIS